MLCFLPEICLLIEQSTTNNDKSVSPIQLPSQISEMLWEQQEVTVSAKNSWMTRQHKAPDGWTVLMGRAR